MYTEFSNRFVNLNFHGDTASHSDMCIKFTGTPCCTTNGTVGSSPYGCPTGEYCCYLGNAIPAPITTWCQDEYGSSPNINLFNGTCEASLCPPSPTIPTFQDTGGTGACGTPTSAGAICPPTSSYTIPPFNCTAGLICVWGYGQNMTPSMRAYSFQGNSFCGYCGSFMKCIFCTYIIVPPGPTVDCVGAWTPWSLCPAPCDGGNQTQTFNVSTPAVYGGMACAVANGTVQMQACNTNVACPGVRIDDTRFKFICPNVQPVHGQHGHRVRRRVDMDTNHASPIATQPTHYTNIKYAIYNHVRVSNNSDAVSSNWKRLVR
ncbi:unnamed protein product [Sphagnum balticum]